MNLIGVFVRKNLAVIQHRPVGITDGESLMAFEIGFGFIMMSAWRYIYTSYVMK